VFKSLSIIRDKIKKLDIPNYFYTNEIKRSNGLEIMTQVFVCITSQQIFHALKTDQ